MHYNINLTSKQVRYYSNHLNICILRIINHNILSHKKSDNFLDRISFLCNIQNKNTNINNINNNNNINTNNNITNKQTSNKEEIKNGELPLIYIKYQIYMLLH